MYATTRDFLTFSEPKVWNDPGYSVIDSTVIEHERHLLPLHQGRAEQHVRPRRAASSSSRRSPTELRDTRLRLRRRVHRQGRRRLSTAGEGPTVFKSNTEDKWYLFIDEFGGRGYMPFETTDLDSGKWTIVQRLPAAREPAPRHRAAGHRRPSWTASAPPTAVPEETIVHRIRLRPSCPPPPSSHCPWPTPRPASARTGEPLRPNPTTRSPSTRPPAAPRSTTPCTASSSRTSTSRPTAACTPNSSATAPSSSCRSTTASYTGLTGVDARRDGGGTGTATTVDDDARLNERNRTYLQLA